MSELFFYFLNCVIIKNTQDAKKKANIVRLRALIVTCIISIYDDGIKKVNVFQMMCFRKVSDLAIYHVANRTCLYKMVYLIKHVQLSKLYNQFEPFSSEKSMYHVKEKRTIAGFFSLVVLIRCI